MGIRKSLAVKGTPEQSQKGGASVRLCLLSLLLPVKEVFPASLKASHSLSFLLKDFGPSGTSSPLQHPSSPLFWNNAIRYQHALVSLTVLGKMLFDPTCSLFPLSLLFSVF